MNKNQIKYTYLILLYTSILTCIFPPVPRIHTQKHKNTLTIPFPSVTQTATQKHRCTYITVVFFFSPLPYARLPFFRVSNKIF